LKRPIHTPLKQTQHLCAILPRLLRRAELYEAAQDAMTRMERAYGEVANHYGFVCRGCEESCCRTLFYHHTYAEFMLLEVGLQSLPKAALKCVRQRASEVQAIFDRDGRVAARSPRTMCPLNRDGRCILYAHRPMICRLHGIPHRLQRPDGRTVSGPGCGRFDALIADDLCDAASSPRLDRTPHYQRLARVEQALRSRLETPIRLNMTLAEWLVAHTRLQGDGAKSAADSSAIRKKAREMYRFQ
jgi:hypothetical protein